MSRLKYALIGCGRISNKHLEAIINNKDRYQPVAFVDIKKSRAEDTAAKIEEFIPGLSINTYICYQKMLSIEKPDVVAIATESGLHYQITVDALSAGTHVICEKPMALSMNECDKIIKARDNSGKKATLCIQNRFNPPILKLKKAIEQGKLGQLYHGQISIRWNRNQDYYYQADWRNTWQLDGGALMNQCSHGIDLLQWMLGGKLKSVYGVIRKFCSPREAEDFGSGIVEFDEGIVGLIEGTVNTYPRNFEERLSIFGEKGTVIIGGLAVNYIEHWKVEGEEFSEEKKEPANVYGKGHTELYHDFYQAIVDDREPFIPIEAGRKSVEIILGIHQSMKAGNKISFPVDFSTEEMEGFFPQ